MSKFYYIFQLIVLIIIGSGVTFCFMFLEMSEKHGPVATNSFLIMLVLIEFLAITILLKFTFYGPILNLKRTILEFNNGNLKDKDIRVTKSLNKDINYINNFFVNTLNNLKSIKSEFLHGKEIKGEVELGKEIQGKMLEKKMIEVPNLDIIIKSKPAGEIGGDSYDIIHSDDNYYIYVGDATGHGVGAGFIMMMVNSLVSGFTGVYKKGNDILSKTNQILKPRVKANLLMSMLLVRWDSREKRLFMTGAGHEYLMIYKASKRKCFKIKSGGVALGMIKDITKLLKEQEIRFEKDDIIVMYSDGITEAINKTKKDGTEEMFGEDRLIKSIEDAPLLEGKSYKTARSVFNNITIDLSQFMGYKHNQFDDVTLGVIHYKGENFDIAHDFPKEINEDFITEWNW